MNLIHGKRDGIEVKIFDYFYSISSEVGEIRREQTVISFRLNTIDLPRFELRPINFFSLTPSNGSKFSLHPAIHFDSFPVFSKKYSLRGHNEKSIRKIFSERILDFFSKNPNICIDARRNTLILYRSNKRVRSKKIRSFLEKGLNLFQLFVEAFHHVRET